MKATKQKLETPKGFEPFILQLEVKTKEEAQALYALFNKTSNAALLNYDCEEIREAIGREFYVQNGSDIISNNISYSEYYYNKKP